MGWNEQRVSFGAIADTYDAYRPDWPAPTAAWLTGTEPTSAGLPSTALPSTGLKSADPQGDDGPPAARSALDVLDLGAGTGKLTRTLVQAGHRVTAADPSEGMLAVLGETLPQVRTVVAEAEHLPLPDRSFDVITVAQAWHWLTQPDAAIECARVLRPGGWLAIAWHRRVVSGGWMLELEELVEAPWDRAERQSVRSHVDEIPLPEQFGELQSTTFEYKQRLTPENLAALVSSWSYVATSPDREQKLVKVEELGRRVAGPDGTLTLPHVTYCYRAPRLANG